MSAPQVAELLRTLPAEVARLLLVVATDEADIPPNTLKCQEEAFRKYAACWFCPSKCRCHRCYGSDGPSRIGNLENQNSGVSAD